MKELKKIMPKCNHCGSTCGLIQFDGDYVCGDYLIRELKITRRALERYRKASPIAEWHEDMGSCLWWYFPIIEPPYVGGPDCDDWPGYHTHFTRLTNEMLPETEQP